MKFNEPVCLLLATNKEDGTKGELKIEHGLFRLLLVCRGVIADGQHEQ